MRFQALLVRYCTGPAGVDTCQVSPGWPVEEEGGWDFFNPEIMVPIFHCEINAILSHFDRFIGIHWDDSLLFSLQFRPDEDSFIQNCEDCEC